MLVDEKLYDGIEPGRLGEASKTMSNLTPDYLNRWSNRHIANYQVGDQPFRMLVEEQESDHVLVVGNEYADGTDSLGAIARALVIRALIDPEASLVIQPNSTLKENNTNFRKSERHQLLTGDASPLTDRINTVIDNIGANIFTVFGPSQGAATVIAFASQEGMSNVATTIVEPPNIVHRGPIALTTNFLTSGKKLKDNIYSNFPDGHVLGNRLIADLNPLNMAAYVSGAIKKENLALTGIMRRPSLQNGIVEILKGKGSIVHAWASGDKVSPNWVNEEIRDLISWHEHYESYQFEGNDHSATNLILECAALVLRSNILLDRVSTSN